MTSEPSSAASSAFVWMWLPGATDPVVAGQIQVTGRLADGQPVLGFAYGTSYRARRDAIALYTPELPLRAGTFDPMEPGVGREPLTLAGCLRDSAPDAWGRRVLNLRLAGTPEAELNELTYLLASGSDRIGALDFQASPTTYVPRGADATLEQLIEMAALTEAGSQIPDDLAAAAGHGTSIGGARPKALLRDQDTHWVAKFPSTSDSRPVVGAEAAAMTLAGLIGLRVPRTRVVPASGRDVLLVERFDRTPAGGRRMMVSALTILGLRESSARYGSYPMLAAAIRSSFTEPKATLTELFTRLVFNVCIGNNDDHLRNHAAFWDGAELTLTPAYDLAPQPRTTHVSTQAIDLTPDGQRASQLGVCRTAARSFLLDTATADDIIDTVVTGIEKNWDQACDAARLTRTERATLMHREFLNPYIFYAQP